MGSGVCSMLSKGEAGVGGTSVGGISVGGTSVGGGSVGDSGTAVAVGSGSGVGVSSPPQATKTPMIAARLGRSRKQKLRRDWESVKVGIMREALLAKFTQYEELQALLLSTGNAKIVEHTSRDNYWGDGGDGSVDLSVLGFDSFIPSQTHTPMADAGIMVRVRWNKRSRMGVCGLSPS